MRYLLNKDQPVQVASSFLSWQVLDTDGQLICDFRGPQSMMCCMAALKEMNNPDFVMREAQDIYEKFAKPE